ncbi:uncharacterized protein PG998_008390 [Apiospora kogelbergensis]|uniref:uncharacterized protein n=1 Tax=Apiospora kogelbergensis TaxID=1337665 RepID=UPI003131A904
MPPPPFPPTQRPTTCRRYKYFQPKYRPKSTPPTPLPSPLLPPSALGPLPPITKGETPGFPLRFHWQDGATRRLPRRLLQAVQAGPKLDAAEEDDEEDEIWVEGERVGWKGGDAMHK